MRMPKYISPSSFLSFNSDPVQHYIRSYSDKPLGRAPTRDYMAIGSGFDALVKAQLTKDLQTTIQFDPIELFEEQVEPQFREALWPEAQRIMTAYTECGAYAVAVEDMGLASLEPRFEFDIKATILGVPVFGKPDAFYHNKNGTPIILDWKVNSYLSGKNMKKPWYVIDHQKGCSHPRVRVKSNNGLPVATNKYLEDTDKNWAFQQFIYAMGLGCELGSEFITSIDQVTGGPSFYTYRAHLSKMYQLKAAKALKQMWEDLSTGYVFRCMGKTREESDKLLKILESPMRDAYL